jgi:VWFA-related protein
MTGRTVTRCLSATFVALAVATSVSAQTPSFSSSVESVRVDVLVTDRGRPVLGLGPSDFEIRDNGVLQDVELASYEEIPLNVILALDMSASVDAERLDHLRGAGRAVLDGLRDHDQAGLVTFSQFVSQGAPLTADVDLVRGALDRVTGVGQTSLIDAAFTGMMIGESDVGRSLLIVFSDGIDTASWLTAEHVLAIAKRCDVVVYGVEVGRRRQSFLRDLSDVTGGRSIEIESTRDIRASFESILQEFRQRYLVSYSPNVARDGWHRLEVNVKGRNATVRARPGYLAR